ncbi:LysR family transcriptional regulator [Kiloniella sp. b19]|uniref:LysR family transcriptional regulator n=1 Tax=Kiloniella sp. GXU_MW_B19 TaxID=3141326 RepID=UPI0031E2BB89
MADLRAQKLPHLEWLRVFEAAARLRSFTAAADELAITQASVSQQMKSLEGRLGRPLFVRKARGIELTLEGESYLPHVQRSLSALQRSTADLFGQSMQELRLAAVSSHVNLLVTHKLPLFHARYPSVRVLTNTIPRRSEYDQDQTALQLRYGSGRWPGRISKLLHREVLVPLCAPELADRGVQGNLAIELRSQRLGWHDWAMETGQELPDFALGSYDTMEHALHAAVYGQGVVLGSIAQAEYLLERGLLVRLDEPELKTPDGYWLTWPEDFAKTDKMRKLVSDLREVLRNPDDRKDRGPS